MLHFGTRGRCTDILNFVTGKGTTNPPHNAIPLVYNCKLEVTRGHNTSQNRTDKGRPFVTRLAPSFQSTTDVPFVEWRTFFLGGRLSDMEAVGSHDDDDDGTMEWTSCKNKKSVDGLRPALAKRGATIPGKESDSNKSIFRPNALA